MPKPPTSVCAKDPAKGCEIINDWADKMYKWALKVNAKLRELEGGPSGVPPPPPPPFK
jgi:hypothetical protein